MMKTEAQQTAERIFQDGLMAIVPGGYPIATLLEIGDALLASPILAMAVTRPSTHALDGVNLLRQRFGEHMLIGCDMVSSLEQAGAAVAAGAQFLLTPHLEPALLRYAAERDVLCLPGVFTRRELLRALAADCHSVAFYASESHGAALLEGLTRPLTPLRILARGAVTLSNIGDYARAGAGAVGIGAELILGVDQSMTDLILRARQLRKLWEAGLG